MSCLLPNCLAAVAFSRCNLASCLPQQEKNNHIAKERASLEEALGADKDVKSLWRDYILDFEKVLKGIYAAQQQHVKDLTQTSKFGKALDWAFTTEDLQVGRTFAEEVGLIPAGEQTGWPLPVDTLEEELSGTHTGRTLAWRLTAHAAFTRLKHVAGYMIMRHQMRPLTLEEIYSKNGHENAGLTHTFNKHAVLKQMVQEKLFDLQDINGAALSHVEAIYRAAGSASHVTSDEIRTSRLQASSV